MDSSKVPEYITGDGITVENVKLALGSDAVEKADKTTFEGIILTLTGAALTGSENVELNVGKILKSTAGNTNEPATVALSLVGPTFKNEAPYRVGGNTFLFELDEYTGDVDNLRLDSTKANLVKGLNSSGTEISATEITLSGSAVKVTFSEDLKDGSKVTLGGIVKDSTNSYNATQLVTVDTVAETPTKISLAYGNGTNTYISVAANDVKEEGTLYVVTYYNQQTETNIQDVLSGGSCVLSKKDIKDVPLSKTVTLTEGEKNYVNVVLIDEHGNTSAVSHSGATTVSALTMTNYTAFTLGVSGGFSS